MKDNANYTITVKEFLKTNPYTTIRTNRTTAKSMLLNNESVIIGGNARYFIIKELGLGVYEISLRAFEAPYTYMAVGVEIWSNERARLLRERTTN